MFSVEMHQVSVRSDAILDQLIDKLPCFTREGEEAVIICVSDLDDAQKAEMYRIVQDECPTYGWVIFFK